MSKAIEVSKMSDLFSLADGPLMVTCLYTGNHVRTISKVGKNMVVIHPAEGDAIVVSGETPVTHEPWVFDRGNLVFKHDGETLKLCGVGDVMVRRLDDSNDLSISIFRIFLY